MQNRSCWPSGLVQKVCKRIRYIDIWRAAVLLVRQHGEDATLHAAMRADESLDVGDLEGGRVWLRILSAVNEPLH